MDSNPAVTDTATTPTINLYPFLMSYGSGNQLIVDWLRVRKYVALPPTVAIGLEESNPTAVTVADFQAVQSTGAVTLTWQTANEIDLIGFHLYRSASEDGEKGKLNTALIPAEHPGQLVGADYEYIDPVEPGHNWYYWLEVVTTRGSEWLGPLISLPQLPYRVLLPVVRR